MEEITVKTDNQSAYAIEFRHVKLSGEATARPDLVLPSASSPKLWVDTKTGTKLPGWRKLVRGGFDASTNYSFKRRVCNVVIGKGLGRYTSPAGLVGYRGYTGHPQQLAWGVLSDPSELTSDRADRLAREQFLAKYRKRRTAFQGSIFLAELKQAVAMIRRPASALRDGIDRYYGNATERYRRAKYKRFVIQDTWLEYSFGWSPLINDIKDACKVATASPSRALEPMHTFSSDTVASSFEDKIIEYPSSFRQRYSVRTENLYRVDYRGAVGYRNYAPPFAEQLGFSWSNVLPTVWEVIPYSFLVDYFTNIGKIVDGISTGVIQLAWGNMSITKTIRETVIDRGLDWKYLTDNCPAGWTPDGYASLQGPLQSLTDYQRKKIDAVSYGFRDFTWSFPTDAKKWLNIAALLPLRFLRKAEPDTYGKQ